MKIKKFVKDCFSDFKKVPSWIVALSAVATVLMNLLANKALFTDGNFISCDCAILVSWVMFLSMDIATQRYGGKASLAITVFDVIVALAMSGIMAGIAAIPESAYSGWFQSEEAAVALNGLVGNNYLVVLTSLFAFVCSSLVDIGSNVGIGKLFKQTIASDKKTPKTFFIYFVRAYGSTFLSQFVDNLVFASIAYPLLFHIPCSPLSIALSSFLGAIIELVAEIVFAPVGFLAVTKKKEEVVAE